MNCERTYLKLRKLYIHMALRPFVALSLIALIFLTCLAAGCGTSVRVGTSSASTPTSAVGTNLTQGPPTDPYYTNAEPAPGVRVTEVSKFYKFDGSTPNEMRGQINNKRPKEYDAWTNWDINYDYTPFKGSLGYVTSNPSVTMEISYTLPRWERPRGASKQTADSWNKYITDLSRHELGHRMIAVQYANKMLQELQPGNVFPSEKALRDSEDANFAAILEQCNDAEAAYDDSTNHGASQGARFP